MLKHSSVFLCLLSLILLSGCTLPEEFYNPDIEGISTQPGYYRVTKVVDGDTIHLDYEGEDTTVRLIGIDTPETKHPRKEVECFGPEAADYLTTLVLDRNIQIELDESQGIYDKYNRLLAYIWLEDLLVNEAMIEGGYAFEYTYNLPYKYQVRFIRAQRFARDNHKGLWGQACQMNSITPEATSPPAAAGIWCKYDCQGEDKDCSDFDGHEDAQEFFLCCGFTIENDPMNLDGVGIGDGLACE